MTRAVTRRTVHYLALRRRLPRTPAAGKVTMRAWRF